MSVVENVRQHSVTLVEQAQLVSQELIRMAILWHEMWHEALEEASRCARLAASFHVLIVWRSVRGKNLFCMPHYVNAACNSPAPLSPCSHTLCRLYFGETNVEGMLNTLLPLHEMMRKQGPTTLKEIAFVQVSSIVDKQAGNSTLDAIQFVLYCCR